MNILIRKIWPDEVSRIRAGAEEFYETRSFIGKFDINYFISFWIKALEKNGVIWVVEDLDNVEFVAGFGGFLGKDQFEPIDVLSCAFFFVRKEHAGMGLKLLKHLINNPQGYDRIYLSSPLSVNAQVAGKLYSKLDCYPLEIVWGKDV